MTDIDPYDPTRDIVESVERQISLLTKELTDTILRIECIACRANLVGYVNARLVQDTTGNPATNKVCNEHAVAPTRP